MNDYEKTCWTSDHLFNPLCAVARERSARFLHDGRIELDIEPVERAIRRVAFSRENYLFAGSDCGGERWAIICSMIETRKLKDVEP